MRSVFIHLIDVDEDEKAAALRLVRPREATTWRRLTVDTGLFRSMPGAPFAYWVPPSIAGLFNEHTALQENGRLVVSTNPLNADFRFARLAWEVPPQSLGSSWITWAKGGAQSDFYADIATLIAWEPQTRTFRGFIGTANRPLQRPASSQHFLRPGITWPRRTGGLSMRVLPAASVFGDKGPAIFVRTDDSQALLTILSVLCSRPFKFLVGLQLARVELAQSFEVGLLQGTPVPEIRLATSTDLAGHARRAWSLRRSLDTAIEVSHAFVAPALLQVEGSRLRERASAWSAQVAAVEAGLDRVQAEIDALCFELYGISEVDRRAIVEGFGVVEDRGEERGGHDEEDVEGDDDDVPVASEPAALAAGLVSWAVGVGVGRFDVRFATGERDWPEEPDPFDPLPACSPGMLTGGDGLPLAEPPARYPVSVSPVLVDDRGHGWDITERVRTVFEVVFGADADAWWSDVGMALRGQGGQTSAWLRKGFFDHHLRMYSRSRRKRRHFGRSAPSRGRIWCGYTRIGCRLTRCSRCCTTCLSPSSVSRTAN
jgi:hypothetical protein